MQSLIYVNEMYMGGPNIKFSLPFVHSKSVSYEYTVLGIYIFVMYSLLKNPVYVYVGFIFEDRCR